MIDIKQLHPILDICDRIEKETNYCVFISYSGHVKRIEIEIAESIEHFNKDIERIGFYTDKNNSDEELSSCIDLLNSVLDDGRVWRKPIKE